MTKVQRFSIKSDLNFLCNTYLYLVTKQWRNTAICTLAKSAPIQYLMPPPNAIKFLVAPFSSIPY